MPIPVTCLGCQKTFGVADQFAGRRGFCPYCKVVLTVPDTEPIHLEPVAEEPAPAELPRRREPSRHPIPRDHLSAWRRVATGFLVQQMATALFLLGLGPLIAAQIISAIRGPARNTDDADAILPWVGYLIFSAASAAQVAGRYMSARTPVRAPRALGYLTAIASAMELVGAWTVGILVLLSLVAAQAPPGELSWIGLLAGLAVIAWCFLVAAGETLHGFAVASVGRVIRARGVHIFGKRLGVGVGVVWVVFMFTACGGLMWEGSNKQQNAALSPAQEGFSFAAIMLVGLYLMLDLILLNRARSAVALIAGDADESAGPDDEP